MKHFALIALLGLAAPAFAETTAAPGKAAACFACHGEGGRSTNSMYPILAGQYPSYIEHALTEYKAGTQGKRQNLIMAGQAAALTKEDIKAVAQYFGAQESPLYTPTVHGALKP
jgi:cytochrome c553